MKTGIILTPREAAQLRKLAVDAQRACGSNLKAFNYCRRVLCIISKAERRRAAVPRASRLLLDQEIINEIIETL